MPSLATGHVGLHDFACYDIKNNQSIGWDVVVNRPKVAAYRAPPPMAAFAVESTIDELAKEVGIAPIDMRLVAREGTWHLTDQLMDPLVSSTH